MSKYQWTCPNCATHLNLNKRVTVKRRACPECGTPVTAAEIDKQTLVRGTISIVTAVAIYAVLYVCGALSQHSSTSTDSSKVSDTVNTVNTENRISDTVPDNLFTSSETGSTETQTSETDESVPTESDLEQLQPETEISDPQADKSISASAINSEGTDSAQPENVSHENTPERGKQTTDPINKLLTAADQSDDASVQSLLLELRENAPHSASFRTDQSAQLHKTGLEFVSKQRYDEAANCFSKAHEITSNDAEIASDLGLALLHANRLAEAETALQTSIALAPDAAPAWNVLGSVYASKHDQHKAIACYLVGYRLSLGQSVNYLRDLDRDGNVAVRLAAAAALERLGQERNR